MESPDVGQILSFNEIKDAVDRIEGGIIHTPLCEAKLTKFMDYDLFLKCENLQYTGSCTERGIRNAFQANFEDYKTHGVIVPSQGNMAYAAAYHGGNMGIPVTVVMPEQTAPISAERCSALSAEAIVCGQTYEETVMCARQLQKETNRMIINSDDHLILAGLGTVGLEIITQLPETDAVIVPVGNGGLLAASLVACKKLKCTCLVYGAECSKVPKMMKALQSGKPDPVPLIPNLAEGLNKSIVGENAFATIRGRLDRMLIVDEVWVARAVISMLERERLVADGAGVCALAAVMEGLVPELRGKRVVCVISSGNIDSGRLSRVIQRGLGACGRLLRFAVAVPDHRAGLESLTKTVSDEGAVLKSIVTEQMWVHGDVGTTWANVVVETADENHAANFKDQIRKTYQSVRFVINDYNAKNRLGVN